MNTNFSHVAVVKLFIAFVLASILAGCAYDYQRLIAESTSPEFTASKPPLNDDEFILRLSAALNRRFPSGCDMNKVIEYVSGLRGECSIETDRLKFPFGNYGPQRDFLICSIPEKSHMYASPFLSSEIQINVKIENDKVQSLRAFRTTKHFP
jgi:hypothetical protein